MTALTHRTEVERERRNSLKVTSAQTIIQPQPSHAYGIKPQKRILSSRSMWKGYCYNKSALVRWNRASQITEGMRWNHYLSSGKHTPMFSQAELGHAAIASGFAGSREARRKAPLSEEMRSDAHFHGAMHERRQRIQAWSTHQLESFDPIAPQTIRQHGRAQDNIIIPIEDSKATTHQHFGSPIRHAVTEHARISSISTPQMQSQGAVTQPGVPVIGMQTQPVRVEPAVLQTLPPAYDPPASEERPCAPRQIQNQAPAIYSRQESAPATAEARSAGPTALVGSADQIEAAQIFSKPPMAEGIRSSPAQMVGEASASHQLPRRKDVVFSPRKKSLMLKTATANAEPE